MQTLLACLAVLLGSGLLALVLRRRAELALWVGAAGAMGGAAGLFGLALQTLGPGFVPLTLAVPLALPGGAFALRLDALSGLFLLLIATLALAAAPFGAAYLRRHGDPRRAGSAACALNLLIAAMVLVVTADNAVLFLAAWELMTLTSFLLVVHEHERPEVREAGRRYLIASQLSGACLLAMFAVLGSGQQELAFGTFAGRLRGAEGATTAVLILALLGFGTKMGLVPLHPWLPLAHPAAPSHVSSLMSGVMIKMGAYGLLRTLGWCERVPAWFAATLVAVGASTALFGILFALAQRDLKRALAYSSIENMGIVATGIGLSALAAGHGDRALADLALQGALLHCTLHALLKGSLFLSAGSILDATHTRDVEQLGGLLARMKTTGTAFLVAAAGICALPPLPSFASEGAILAAGLSCATALPAWGAILVAAAILALALAGGLAVAGFTRLFGLVCLGQPRSAHGPRPAAGRPALEIPPALLAALAVTVGLVPFVLLGLPGPAARTVVGAWMHDALGAGGGVGAGSAAPALLRRLALACAAFAAVLAALALLRSVLLRRRPGTRAATWGCGYSQPSERMQYTSASYGQPLVSAFEAVLAPEYLVEPPRGKFPESIAHVTRVADRVEQGLYVPLFAAIGRRLFVVRRLQDGNLHRYLLQIVAGLGIGLGWMVLWMLLGDG